MQDRLEAWPFYDRARTFRVSPHRSCAPAMGLAFAGGTSLGMWMGLCVALRWAAQLIF